MKKIIVILLVVMLVVLILGCRKASVLLRVDRHAVNTSHSIILRVRKDGKIIHYQYTNEEIDYFSTIFNGKCYLIPVEECGSDKRLRILPTKNGQIRGISWAKNYEMEEVIKNW